MRTHWLVRRSPENSELQIAVFRKREGEYTNPRMYNSYRYRSGLRYERLLRILGRHGGSHDEM